jgi:hypothetical protein
LTENFGVFIEKVSKSSNLGTFGDLGKKIDVGTIWGFWDDYEAWFEVQILSF